MKTVLIAVALLCSPAAGQERAEEFDRLAAQATRERDAGRIEAAEPLYRRALALRPNWAEGWWYLGTLRYDRDDYAGAEGAFTRAATIKPDFGPSWIMLGLCEFKLGRHDQSLAHLRRGRRLGIPDDQKLRRVVLYHEGLLLLGRGNFEAAQKTLGTLSRETVENDELIFALGLSVLRIRPSNLPASDDLARQVVGIAGRAEYFAARKEFSAAAREYDRLAHDFAKVPNVKYAYGRFLLVANEEERAIEALQGEIENNPRHLLARLLIAEMKIKRKDAAGALPYIEESLRLYPQLPLANYLLGVSLLETGAIARAIVALEAARRAEPDDPRVHFALGKAYARAGRKAEAARARAEFERLSRQAEGGDDEPGRR